MKKFLTLLCAAFLLHGITGAQVVSTFPHMTDFETESTCGTSCTGSCNLLGHWRNGDQWGFAQAGTDWIVDVGGTSSSNTGPGIDHTLGTSTGKYVYTETSGCTNITAHLVSGYYDFSGVSSPIMRFWYHMYGATMGTMHVDVDTTQGTGSWVLDVVPSWTDNVDLWQEATVSLAAFSGKDSVRIRIRGITGTSFTSDMAVDDIEIFQPLPNDVNLVALSAGGGCGNSSTTPVVMGLSNFGTDTIPAGTSIPVAFETGGNTVWDTIITNMAYAPGDTFFYTFVNGAVDLSGPSAISLTGWSAWSLDLGTGNDTLTVSAFGIPIISTYPYFEDFEQGQNGWTINNGANGTWAFGTPAKTVIIGAASGVNCFVNGGLTGDYNNTDNSYVEGPCFDFTNVCDPVISARIWWNAEFSWDGMNITASTDGGVTWTLVGAHLDPLNWYNDNTIAGNPGGSQIGWSGRTSSSNGSGGWVNARHRLIGMGGQANVKIRFNFGSDGSVIDDGVAFDDVHIFNGTDFGDDQLACGTGSFTLNAYHGNAAATYLWNDGSTNQTLTATSSGTYTVTIDAGGGCITTESINITILDTNATLNLGADTTQCGGSVMLDPMWPMTNYLWSTGDTTPTLTVSSTGNYDVYAVNACGIYADTIAVTINALPTVDLGQDTTACDSYVLDAANAGSTILWSTGDSTQTITATTSGTYAVLVTDGNGCMASDSVVLNLGVTPVVSLGPDQLLCDGFSSTLDAGNPGSIYNWSTGDTTQTISVATAGTITVIVSDALGCSAIDTINVSTETTPVVSFSFIAGSNGLDFDFTDLSTGSNNAYLWDFGDGNTSTLQNPSHTYATNGNYTVTLTVANGCGTGASIQSITVVAAADLLNGAPLTVFPNPSQGHFELQGMGNGEAMQLEIHNLAGQNVYQQVLNPTTGLFSAKVQLEGQPAGIYFLRVMSADQVAIIKLNIQ